MFTKVPINSFFSKAIASLALSIATVHAATAQKDTLRVMAYNVLYYGNGCQGPNANYHGYLKTIIGYTNPDIVSLEKMSSVPLSADDKFGAASYGFQDSILRFALNGAFEGRYSYCPPTNNARAHNTCMVFYDQHKLGYAGLVASYANGVDYNTHKLYYKSPNLDATHDTTFLYITTNHDKSGDDFADAREMQITGELNTIKHHFTKLANHINLGDFNARSSEEGFYQALTVPTDTGFRFYDPPFYPDGVFKYPATWDHEGKYSAYFTTSTREAASPCGSGGGGKNWYDHIFISRWLVDNTNGMRYIPHSYQTVGNDGQRFKVSIVNKNSHTNTSAPQAVLEALHQMSNKYPVMISLEASQNSGAMKPQGTEKPYPAVVEREEITLAGNGHFKAGSPITINIPEALMAQELTVQVLAADGEKLLKKTTVISGTTFELKNKLPVGTYSVKFKGRHNLISEGTLVVE